MGINQFSIYQLKQTADNKKLQYCSWENVQKQNLQIRVENYNQVYMGKIFPTDTPVEIWKRFQRKTPKSFHGHALSVSDVIVWNQNGIVSSYYIDKEQLYQIAGFIRQASSGSLITIDTRDFQIDGVNGNWIATDDVIVDGNQFFLMQHEAYGKDAAFIVVSAEGKMVADDCYHGFDESMIKRIREFLHPTMQQNREPFQKRMENWQKAMENGEYLRTAEISEEQNYNMVDGLFNNCPRGSRDKNPKERTSVLTKLRQKQTELALKYGSSLNSIEAAMERDSLK